MVKSLHHRPLTRVGVRGRPPPSRDASEIFLTEGLGYKKIIMPMPMLSIILEKFTKYDTKTVFGLSFRCYFLRTNDEYFRYESDKKMRSIATEKMPVKITKYAKIVGFDIFLFLLVDFCNV